MTRPTCRVYLLIYRRPEPYILQKISVKKGEAHG